MRIFTSMISAVLLTSVAPLLSYGQTAQVTGTVADPSGALIAGARLIATNVATEVARSTVTNASGNYLITALLPGTYRVSAEASGFRTVERGPITLTVDQIARIDFAMELGQTQQTLVVESSNVILDTESSTVGDVVSNKQVSETPLNGRDPIDLVGLATGIRVQGGFGGKNGSWGNFSPNGGLANANSVMVEGLSLDLAQMNSPSYVPPVDSTQEFRIETNTFSAEQGRTSGAVVSFSIKSGTNQFHGSLYEFLRITC